MKKLLTVVLFGALALTVANGQPFEDDFESGMPDASWGLYRAGEEPIQAVTMASAPAALANGGDYVGMIQDADASYSGAAIAWAGSVTDANYTVEGDVYVYTNHPDGSAYTGLLAYADSAAGVYYKLVADFDSDHRLRLYNNKMDATYQYTFSVTFDADAVDTTEGWHHMRLKVETLEGGYPSFTCYYDGVRLGDGAYVDSTSTKLTAGYYGVYAFQMDADGIAGYFDNVGMAGVFNDDFESGTAHEAWGLYRDGEEPITAVAMASAPAVLATGGDYVGLIQDADASYSGAAVITAGGVAPNYTVEGDVYVYTNHPGGSAYTGLLIYADSAAGVYYKLVADFDSDHRLRLYNNKMDASYQYTFSVSFDADAVDTTEGWHHMMIVAETLEGGYPSFTCYYDGQMLGDGAYIDSSDTKLSKGQFGVYAFQMDSDGIAGYFDNVKAYYGGNLPLGPTTAIEPRNATRSDLPVSFALAQNYPNPFNPTTSIPLQVGVGGRYTLDVYNISGRQVRSLLNEALVPNSYSILWDGRDQGGRLVPSGVYLYSLTNGSQRVSKRMVLLK